MCTRNLSGCSEDGSDGDVQFGAQLRKRRSFREAGEKLEHGQTALEGGGVQGVLSAGGIRTRALWGSCFHK